MNEHAPDNQEIEATERQTLEALRDRLMQEINILRLEGALFCFDPRQAKRREGTLDIEVSLPAIGKQTVTIELHPKYGQPSVLAYKVMQAIFLKIADDGCELTEDGRCLYRDTVFFSWRELARMTGRAWCAKTSNELYHAVMQLQRTLVTCSFYDKETGEWLKVQFYVLPLARFAGKGSEIKVCAFTIDSTIINSINKKHFVFFNLQRLDTLDTIGVVLYKRIFFHLSNIYQGKASKHVLKFEKDYEDICREWLGGLKPEKYKSKILQNQLGRHLEGLTRTGLIRRYDIVPKVHGTGFKLVVWAGESFFADYRDYYLKSQAPRLQVPEVPGVREIQQPLELVAEFHKLLGHTHQHFEEKEIVYAAQLLRELSDAEVRDLIAYAVEDATATGFAQRMRWFGVLRNYRERWQADHSRRVARKQTAEIIAACPYCNEQGYLPLTDPKNYLTLYPCPHGIARIGALEQERGLRRV